MEVEMEPEKRKEEETVKSEQDLMVEAMEENAPVHSEAMRLVG